MRYRYLIIFCALMTLGVAALSLNRDAGAANTRALWARAAGVPRAQDPQAERIERREQRENGITVTEPRVFDDSLLEQRLQELESRLGALQLIDQKALTDRFGAVSGAQQQISSVGFNVQGPSVPGVTTNTKLPTQATTQNTAAGATTSSLQVVSNLATEDVSTTKPQFNPPSVAAPAPTTTLPSLFSVSSSDTLNEMMQLTAEINGLRMMLSGDLTSYFVRSPSNPGQTKYKTTLGFDISIKPDNRFRDAVAVVEVEAENVCSTLSDEAPTIATLLPREKTYNVAAITDKSTSFSGGVATQILGVSGSWLRGHKTYYLVQDQDTVALTFTPEDQPNNVCTNPQGGRYQRKRVGFRWEFRPVLGRRSVRIADKMTFVQLAFPVLAQPTDNKIGKVTVRSYWREYDRNRGLAKNIIPGSVREQSLEPFDITTYSLVGEPPSFNYRDTIEDLGGGNLLVKLPGRFLPGTNVRIGPKILVEGDQFKHRYSGIQFVASLSELVTKRSYLVGHDGSEIPLVFNLTQCTEASPLVFMGMPRVTTFDDANSRVTVRVNHPEWAKTKPEDWLNPTPPIVFVVGTRVFGFSDAPLQQKGAELSFVAPTALLAANPVVTVQTLFPGLGCVSSMRLDSMQAPAQGERLVLLEQGEKKVKFLLYGTRLSGLSVLAPSHALLSPVGKPADPDRLLQLEVDAADLKTHKQILVQRRNERPFVIPIPALEAAKKPDPPKAHERLTVDIDEAVIDGEGLGDLEKVSFGKKDFRASDVEVAEDGKSVRLSNLRSYEVTKVSGTKPVTLKFKSGGKATVNLDVVDSKVETVVKQP